MPKTCLYRSVGPELTLFAVDLATAALDQQGTVTLPADVQCAWPHPSTRYLYVVSSNGGPGKAPGDTHLANAFRIDPRSGTLAPHGDPQTLPSRPIHCCVDGAGKYLLTAFNFPSAVTVHRINSDGTLGDMVTPPTRLDCGVYAHQVRTTPSNRKALLVCRGNDPWNGSREEAGSLKVLGLDEGALENEASIGRGEHVAFGPRHLDFHPRRPWVFVLLEPQNQLCVYSLRSDDSLAPDPLFVRSTLADPDTVHPGQVAGAIQVHPTGRWLYVTNRNSEVVDFEGTKVAQCGENNVAVFAIDGHTGAPTLVEHSEADAIHLRTISIDPTGSLLVGASIAPMVVREGGSVRVLPAGLSVYRVGGDGRLGFVRTYDIETGESMQFWSGMVTPVEQVQPVG